MAVAGKGTAPVSAPAAPDAGAGSSDAISPHRIPFRAWLRILRRAGRHVLSDRLQVASAGIAFFAVLSIAPMLVTALSVYGAVNTPAQAMQQMASVAGRLPPELQPLVLDQLTTITAASTQVHTFRGLTGLVIALWTATTAAGYLVDALTLAYHETETRGFLRRMGLALTVVLGGALLLGAVLAVAGAVARAADGAAEPVRLLVSTLAWPALAAVMAGALAVLYRFAPDRKQARWRWISGGAMVTTVLWLATSIGLFAYVQSLGNYASTYGSLAGVAISMFWLWISVFLVILGASVNAEAERQTVRDSTVGPEQPLGRRGAVVADSAPPYPGEE
ncbi:YihY/virulence factor BrkB family protein [Blastococcus sp. CT_GayMR19]|uniref:YihY/virulence factor BrkB family protein n=1 Tax=Blastococcus sp. CT_GayMR19 TaxID=2559608 RepID=UPI00107334AC|nr:YihY/virulence factor BrkB family protein [Blastococcus sp. CT_GayMR19]TFV77371.1 YihY/virulence factor BrkB family protein [Blastococcus sp. CT_GayMR19]